MINHVFDIPIKFADGADIFFFGDEQEYSEGFDAKGEAWQAFVAEWKRSKNPWGVHMGDAMDWIRPTMRDAVGSVLLKDPSAKRQLDNMVRDLIDKTADRLSFTKGRLIGMHEGHHDYEFLGGLNATMLLAEKLKSINLGWMAATRLSLLIQKHGGSGGYSFTMATTHGNAGGRATTSVAASMERSLKDYVCDLKVAGHACRSASWVPEKFRWIKRSGAAGIVDVMPRHLLVGGFCDAYTDGWTSTPTKDPDSGRMIGGRPKSGYAERRNLTAQPLMWGVVRIKVVQRIGPNREVGKKDRSPSIDIEAVNRGPSVRENGEW